MVATAVIVLVGVAHRRLLPRDGFAIGPTAQAE